MAALPSSLALTSIATNAQILSADHRNNYSAIQTAVNALITALSGGTSGQELQATGASSVAYVTPSSTVTYRKTTSKTVNTTVAKTDLLNAEITLAANDLGTNRRATLRANGDWKQNSGGATAPPRFVFDLGGTTILDTGTPAGTAANSATRCSWWIEVVIQEMAATNVQSVTMRGGVGQVSALTTELDNNFTTGEGSYFSAAFASILSLQGWNSGAKDGTGTLAVALSTINASASANYEVVLKDAMVVIE